MSRKPTAEGDTKPNCHFFEVFGHYPDIYDCAPDPKYRICGNKVEVIEVGSGTLVCWGREMKSIEDKPETTVNLPDSGGR